MPAPTRSQTRTARPVLTTADLVLSARGLSWTAGGRAVLDRVDLDLRRGELVALVGGSGTGKSTLLELLAGLRRPAAGGIVVDDDDNGTPAIGFVPQDDIIHRDLRLRATLDFAARLRLPRRLTRSRRAEEVARVLAALDLDEQADVRVRDLSGGQRKRASIAVELLGRPALLLLDEPTSGLDPGTAAEVMAVLRRLTFGGTAVVLSTHSPADLVHTDRVLGLGGGGCITHDGRPEDLDQGFGMPQVQPAVSRPLSAAPTGPELAVGAPVDDGQESHAAPPGPGVQTATLAHRGLALMLANRLTGAILAGSPLLVIAMLAMLFTPGAFRADNSPVAAVQLVYWIAFAGFFFGLTYGLLQIVTELAVLRRERFAGLSAAAYVAAKLVLLVPLLGVVGAALLAVLRLLDRLPAATPDTWLLLWGTFLLDACAGLGLGLLASAGVTNVAQATLALPMLCFPQVLFAGAMVPVSVMTEGARAMSWGTSNRWGFEALGRLLDLSGRFGHGGSLGGWSPAFAGGATHPVVLLVLMTLGSVLAAVAMVRARTTVR
jgi:ABC-type multidrug transport system ATPase subunit